MGDKTRQKTMEDAAISEALPLGTLESVGSAQILQLAQERAQNEPTEEANVVRMDLQQTEQQNEQQERYWEKLSRQYATSEEHFQSICARLLSEIHAHGITATGDIDWGKVATKMAVQHATHPEQVPQLSALDCRRIWKYIAYQHEGSVAEDDPPSDDDQFALGALQAISKDPSARPQPLPAVQLVVDRRWFQHPETLPLLITDNKAALENSSFQDFKTPFALSQTAAWHHQLHQKYRKRNRAEEEALINSIRQDPAILHRIQQQDQKLYRKLVRVLNSIPPTATSMQGSGPTVSSSSSSAAAIPIPASAPPAAAAVSTPAGHPQQQQQQPPPHQLAAPSKTMAMQPAFSSTTSSPGSIVPVAAARSNLFSVPPEAPPYAATTAPKPSPEQRPPTMATAPSHLLQSSSQPLSQPPSQQQPQQKSQQKSHQKTQQQQQPKQKRPRTDPSAVPATKASAAAASASAVSSTPTSAAMNTQERELQAMLRRQADDLANFLLQSMDPYSSAWMSAFMASSGYNFADYRAMPTNVAALAQTNEALSQLLRMQSGLPQPYQPQPPRPPQQQPQQQQKRPPSAGKK